MIRLSVIFYLVLFIHFIGFGQIEKPITKNNIYVNGNFSIHGINTIKKEKPNEYSFMFDFSPGFGYFFIDRLSVGISPIFSMSWTSSKHNIKDSRQNLEFHSNSKSTAFGLSPFLKYYFNNGIFLNSNFIYSYNKTTYSNSQSGTIINNSQIDNETQTIHKYNQLGYLLGCGYAYFPNSQVSIEASLKYSKTLKRLNNETTYYISGQPVDNIDYEPDDKYEIGDISFEIGFYVFL